MYLWCGIYTRKQPSTCKRKIAAFCLQLKYVLCYPSISIVKTNVSCILWHIKLKLWIRDGRIMSQHVSFQALSSLWLSHIQSDQYNISFICSSCFYSAAKCDPCLFFFFFPFFCALHNYALTCVIVGCVREDAGGEVHKSSSS